MNRSALATGIAGLAIGLSVFGVAACLPDADTLPAAPVAPPAASSAPAATPGALPTYTLPPCPTEDSDDCYWDAARMGNGQGTSFVSLQGITYRATN